MAYTAAKGVAANESRFREANEGIEARATELGYHVHEELVPFLCECGDERCTELIRLTLVEYETARSNPLHFVCRVGHERVAESTGAGRLVRREDRFVVVEKEGVAAAVAEERDPRTEQAKG